MDVEEVDDLQEKRLEIDKQSLTAPVKNAVDKYQLVPEFLKVRGLVKEHLNSFNYFVRKQIKEIVRANNLITYSRDPNIFLRYNAVRIGEPSMLIDGVSQSLSPQMFRLNDTTYAAPVYVSIEYMNGHGANQIQKKKDVLIGRLPIMLRSCCCILNGRDEEELAKFGECPLDPGGYFIIKGTEKVTFSSHHGASLLIIYES